MAKLGMSAKEYNKFYGDIRGTMISPITGDEVGVTVTDDGEVTISE